MPGQAAEDLEEQSHEYYDKNSSLNVMRVSVGESYRLYRFLRPGWTLPPDRPQIARGLLHTGFAAPRGNL
jgi:hypothetical protein